MVIKITKRNITLDLIRTTAIILMVIFHFIYDLKYFGWITTNIPDGDGWKHFRYIILSLFFICVGASLVYSNNKKTQYKQFVKRLIKVAIGALLITIMSLFMFPNTWIYFGVLHFIVIASIFTVFFVPYPRLALLVGIFIIMIEQQGWLNKQWPFNYMQEHLPHYTTDYVPLFPWLGVILLGIALAHSSWFNHLPIKKTRLINLLALPGKHSLLIYLIHQPILFALLAPIHWVMTS